MGSSNIHWWHQGIVILSAHDIKEATSLKYGLHRSYNSTMHLDHHRRWSHARDKFVS